MDSRLAHLPPSRPSFRTEPHCFLDLASRLGDRILGNSEFLRSIQKYMRASGLIPLFSSRCECTVSDARYQGSCRLKQRGLVWAGPVWLNILPPPTGRTSLYFQRAVQHSLV